ncbi:MAG: hypothetical protein CMP93_03160 [Gammaproteobacteria bacterium]|nr:hypothetical protein [Gammaproteobacteria bacterium]
MGIDNFSQINVPGELIQKVDSPRCSLDVQIELQSPSEVITGDIVRLQSFSGSEGISQEFEFQLDLRVNDYTLYDSSPVWEQISPLSDSASSMSLDRLLGAPITVMLGLPETEEEQSGTYPEDRKVSYFNGIIFSVGMKERGVWNITMKPRLSRLHLQSSYRIFEDQTILEVISNVLNNNQILNTSYALDAYGNMNEGAGSSVINGLGIYRRQDWLQSGETDFEFLNRLMDKAGIFYYFVHSLTDHIMVLTDQSYYQSLYEDGPLGSLSGASQSLKKLYLTGTKPSYDIEDNISDFKFERSLAVNGVSTIVAQQKAAWDSQSPADVAPVYRDDTLSETSLSMEKLHLVSFGASEEELTIRREQLESQLLSAKSSLSGSSCFAGLRSGYMFALQESVDSEASGATSPTVVDSDQSSSNEYRPELVGVPMVAVTVSHKADAEGHYSNEFSAFDAQGYGQAFKAEGDQEGVIIAQVCDETDYSLYHSTVLTSGASKLTSTGATGINYLKQGDFVSKANKTFSTPVTGTEYDAKGVYVQFVSQGQMNAPVWVRLSNSMTTIPEKGTFVSIARARDETEIPEITQVLDSVGSKNAMPSRYSSNTSWGDSYSANYGGSYRISVPETSDTDYSTFTSIVNSAETTGSYDDVSFSESASYNFSISKLSRSVSLTGVPGSGVNLSSDFAFTGDAASAAQASQSVNYGSSYTKNETVGESRSLNIQHGKEYSDTKSYGGSDSEVYQEGYQHSVTTLKGDSYTKTDQSQGKSTTRTEMRDSESHNTVTGKSKSYDNTNESISSSVQGSSLSTNVVGASMQNSVTGVSNTNSLTGVSGSVSVTGASTELSVTGASTSLKLTGWDGSISIARRTDSIKIDGIGIRYQDKTSTPEVETTLFGVKIVGGMNIIT